MTKEILLILYRKDRSELDELRPGQETKKG